MGHGTVYVQTFVMQMRVAQQTVDALDVVFGEGRAQQAATDMRQIQLAARKQSADRLDHGRGLWLGACAALP